MGKYKFSGLSGCIFEGRMLEVQVCLMWISIISYAIGRKEEGRHGFLLRV